MSDWKHIAGVIEFTACRTGWLGVWDALVSAIKNHSRLETNQARTIEYWVNDRGLDVKVDGKPAVGTLYVNGVKHER